MRTIRRLVLTLGLLPLLVPACSEDAQDPLPSEGTELPTDSLPLGDVTPADMKADGVWGAATTCKPIPDLPRLGNPSITISLNGLTLHLTDPDTGYDRVFPIGPGVQDQDDESLTYGESLSYYPVLATGRSTFQITPATSNPCAIWWTDRATGQRLPVFAGLPFLSWYGSYGIHGPVDNYRAANGGSLRRGYVSHGCIRMEAADILEVFGRIRGVPRVPVQVLREPERLPDGRVVDVPARWIGAECQGDGDCNYDGGFCQQNPFSGRGFCSKRCSPFCPDRAGYPTTFCMSDPVQPDLGMCVPREQSTNLGCRPYDHMVPKMTARHTQPDVRVRACVPGSPGWVGDRCFVDADCLPGNHCKGAAAELAGICTLDCNGLCPDQPGWPWTFCASDAGLGDDDAGCLRQCTPALGAPECPAGFVCEPRQRSGGRAATKDVCVRG